jgi:DNA adenine methylase
MNPVIKWSGGKREELPYITPYLPEKINRYFEPFIGGGAMWLNMKQKRLYINDLSSDLINFYQKIKDNDSSFYKELNKINKIWVKIDKIFIKNSENLISMVSKNIEEINIFLDEFISDKIKNLSKKLHNEMLYRTMNSYKKIKKTMLVGTGFSDKEEILNMIKSGFKGGVYYHIRNLYNNKNNKKRMVYFFFIKELAYSGMYRVNRRGDFNVAYGGISYNSKNFSKKISNMLSIEFKDHLLKTKISNQDFEVFLNSNKIRKNDFIFIDPPYDTKFKDYEGNSFNMDDHIRLYNYLKTTKANWIIVVNDNINMRELYKEYIITNYEKDYRVNFKNRNSKKTNHLLIKNY